MAFLHDHGVVHKDIKPETSCTTGDTAYSFLGRRLRQNEFAACSVVEDVLRFYVVVDNAMVVKERQSVPYSGEFCLARVEGGS